MLKKRLSVVLVFSLFLASACFAVNFPNISAQTTLNVPSAQYPTIQSAINAASNGSTINIAAGIYNENVSSAVWRNNQLQTFGDLTIQGAKDTVINGNVIFGPFVNVKVDSLTINGKLTAGNAMEGVVKDCSFTNIKATTIWSYTTNSVFGSLQVSGTLNLAGVNNTVTSSTLNAVQLGGNGPGASTVQNTIKNSVITGGITAPGAIQTTITGNVIAGAAVGISEAPPTPSRYGSGGLVVYNNSIQNCGVGIYLASAYNYRYPASVTENTIANNGVGIAVLFGDFPLPMNNTIYRNNFVDNKLQVNCTGTARSDVWSYGNTPNGNYWSDYRGVDANGDGIGDTPYIINSVNNDSYPLMGTYPPTATPTSSPTPTTQPTNSPSQTPTPTNEPTQTASPTQTTQTATPTPTLNPTGENAIPEMNASYLLIALFTVAAALGSVVALRKRGQRLNLHFNSR